MKIFGEFYFHPTRGGKNLPQGVVIASVLKKALLKRHNNKQVKNQKTISEN
jgi:hypothetical protein